MTYAKLVKAEPETGRILQLHLDDGNIIRIWGTRKQLRKAIAGGNYEGINVVYNKKMFMLEEDWEKIQPILSKMNFGPLLNQQIKMSYDELQDAPRWGWKSGLRDYGSGSQRLFTYHPINFRRASNPNGYLDLYCAPEDKENHTLFGMVRELNFPEDEQMTMWRFRDLNLETLEYKLEDGISPNEYFCT